MDSDSWLILLATSGVALGSPAAEPLPLPATARELRALSYPAIHTFARLSSEERELECKSLAEDWEPLGEWIRRQPVRTAESVQVSQRYLAAVGSACDNRFIRLPALIADLGQWGGSFLGGGHGFPSAILRMLPAPEFTSGKGDSTRIEADRAFSFFWNGVVVGLKDASCSSRVYTRISPPESPECFADWLWSGLEQSNGIPLNPPSPEARKRMRAEVEEMVSSGPISSWSGLLSLPFRLPPQGSVSRFAGSAHAADALLSQNTPAELARLLNRQATALHPVLHLNSGSVRPPCRSVQEKSRDVLAALPKSSPENDSMALATVGQLLMAACAAYPWTSSLDALVKTSPEYGFEGAASRTESMPAALISEADSPEDMRLRDALELRFHYGTQFDLEDWNSFTSEERFHALLDSVLAFQLRTSASAPWIHLAENIEEALPRHELMAKVLRDFGKHPIGSKRILQLAYLEAQDLGVQSWGDDPALVERIQRVRAASQILKASLPAMRELSNLIHNGVHRGLVSEIRRVKESLSQADQQTFQQHFALLESEMNSLFGLHLEPLALLRELRSQWHPLKPHDAIPVDEALSSMGDSKGINPRKLLAATTAVVRDLNAREQKVETPSRAYVFTFRLLRELRNAYFSLPALSNRGRAEWFRALGGSRAERLPRELDQLLEERRARFLWLLETQRRRLTPHPLLVAAQPFRRAALEQSVSLLLRPYELNSK